MLGMLLMAGLAALAPEEEPKRDPAAPPEEAPAYKPGYSYQRKPKHFEHDAIYALDLLRHALAGGSVTPIAAVDSVINFTVKALTAAHQRCRELEARLAPAPAPDAAQADDAAPVGNGKGKGKGKGE